MFRKFRHTEDRRFFREWLLLGCISVILLVTLVASGVTTTGDYLVYDWWLQQQSHPPSSDIVIVAVDNESLTQLGRWPWPRQMHADAIRQIAAAKPRSIIYDILFTEHSPDDAALATAMSLTDVYLPVLIEKDPGPPGTGQPRVPVEPLRSAAAGLGHINLEINRDGLVRGAALFEGNSTRMWPQLTVPAFVASHDRTAALPREVFIPDPETGSSDPLALRRTESVLIPFMTGAQAYPRVSFSDVLQGQVSSAFFHDKFVFLGVTADGLLEHLATPVSSSNGYMPGVEIHANILDALLTERSIHTATRNVICGWSLIPLMLLFAGFLFMAPRQWIWLIPALACLAFLGCGALLLYAATWVPPIPTIVVLIVIYPLWSWRRLNIAMSFISAELERLAAEPQLTMERYATQGVVAGNTLERNISLMRQAAQQLRDLKCFIWDSLNSLPDPALVADSTGHIRLANQLARDNFTSLQVSDLNQSTLQDILKALTFIRAIGRDTNSVQPSLPQWADWLDPTHTESTAIMERGVEVRDTQERHYVLKYARCRNASGESIGWIANLSDITTLNAVQRQRDEMLHLLSHDMRSPQSSIIALIELERARSGEEERLLTLDRIERYARRTLALADSFVRLAAAETQDYNFELVNFIDLLHNAIDEVWSLANAKHITIACETAEDEFLVEGDPSMIARALVNLLNNAIKYSPSSTRIDCTLSIAAEPLSYVECMIRDQGYGIPHERRMHLFERFQRFQVPGQPDSDGIGLGLTFVKAVVTRHGGIIRCDSAPGYGTTMTIHLPCADDTTVVSTDHARVN
jgi:CHASE2 domain-containing sensor protein/nitrogen-specific signal transduction histidine kinase